MAKVGARIAPAYRGPLFFVLAAAWITGLLYLGLDTWGRVEGDFGLEPHPWQATTLKIHGAVAFLMIWAFGYLAASHVPAGRRTGRSRRLGHLLLGALAFMTVSAYGLYYASSETLRDALAVGHVAVGFALPFLVAAHVWTGVRRRRQARLRRAVVSRTPWAEETASTR